MVFTLPLDVALLVIDQLGALSPRAASLNALRACALTCRAWRSLAHRHLFVAIYIGGRGPRGTTRLNALRKRPDLCAHARLLVLDAPPGAIRDVIAFLASGAFINVHTLRVRHAKAMPLLAEDAVSAGLPALRALIIFDPPGQAWNAGQMHIALAHLHTVALYNNLSDTVPMRLIAGLASSPARHTIAELTVSSLLDAEFRTLGQSLAKLTALRRLAFQPQFSSYETAEISWVAWPSWGPCLQSTTLHHLSFMVPLVVAGLQYIRRLLRDARLPALRTLAVKFTTPPDMLSFVLPTVRRDATARAPLLPTTVARSLARVELSFRAPIEIQEPAAFRALFGEADRPEVLLVDGPVVLNCADWLLS